MNKYIKVLCILIWLINYASTENSVIDGKKAEITFYYQDAEGDSLSKITGVVSVRKKEPVFGITALGSSGFLITWDPQSIPNAAKVDFKFYYQGKKDEKPVDVYGIANATDGQYKIFGLNENEKYKIIVEKREISHYSLEGRTSVKTNQPPTKPDFKLEKKFKYRFLVIAFVRWLPCGVERNCEGKIPGTHFIVKLRLKNSTDEIEFIETRDDYYEIYHLFAGKHYEVVVTSVNEDLKTDSDPKEIFFPAVTDPVESVKVLTLSGKSALCTWKPPKQASGSVTAYKVAYSTSNRSVLLFDNLNSNSQYETVDEYLDELHTKITYLDSNTKYSLYVIPRTEFGIGTEYRIEFTPNDYSEEVPLNKPELSTKLILHQFYTLVIFWLPCGKSYECKNTKPGTDFYVKYKKENDTIYTLRYIKDKDYAKIEYLAPGTTYEIIVTSILESDEADSDIVKIAVPQTDPPSDILEVLHEQNISIPCKAPRSSAPEIQWFMNGNPVEGTRHSDDFYIDNVRLWQREKYTCLDKNLKNDTNFTTFLIPRTQSIMYSPNEEYSVQTVVLGETVKLSCEVSNDLDVAVDISWNKDGKYIGGEFEKPIDPELMRKWASVLIENNEALGNYTCVMKSKFQQISRTISVELKTR